MGAAAAIATEMSAASHTREGVREVVDVMGVILS
jgi:hypothetical protein